MKNKNNDIKINFLIIIIIIIIKIKIKIIAFMNGYDIKIWYKVSYDWVSWIIFYIVCIIIEKSYI